MLPVDGRVVAPPDIRASAWLGSVSGEEAPLVLAPGSTRGWFGGRAVVAWAPTLRREGLTLAEAARELEISFSADTVSLTVVLLPYDGPATTTRYPGGLVWTEAGWRIWGSFDADRVAAVGVPGQVAPLVAPLAPAASLAKDVRGDLSGVAFRVGVREVAEAVRAGDVYVLNLTRRLTGRPTTDPVVAFASLVDRTRADMAAFWRTPSTTLASASPERFLRVAGGRVEVCPIKGTRPRAEGDSDCAMAAELAASEKERAEHVMIVDLERNDIGRVCRPGSVSADPLFQVIVTPYCHQMVSSVSGTLRAEASLGDLLTATFPCGSVTGAPKIAAMRAIARLEASPRGAYTGSLVVAVPGEVDSSVLIRTAEYAGDVVRWGTGGGITVDSDPAEEWLETLLKASPLLGDGVPVVALRETCRVVFGGVPLLARHLARLSAGGCGPTVLAQVRSRVTKAIGDADEAAAYGRLTVTVDPTGEVSARVTDAVSSLAVPGGPVLLPVPCATPRLPVGAAKPADREPWDDAQRRAVEAGAHQAVLVDERGHVTDGATASLWVRVGQRLLTPPAPPAIEGVARGVVFDVAAGLGYTAEEAEVSEELLDHADEVFLTNALAGAVAVRGRSGLASTALREVFRGLFGE